MMTPEMIASFIEPPVVHDLLHVGLFCVDIATALLIGGVVYLLALLSPGMRL